MTVVDIHPEDLIDKLTRSELSTSERAHLSAHLKGCGACRLELELRGDYERHAADMDVSQLPSLQLTRGLVSPVVPRRAVRSRRWAWGVAVAGLVTATGAVAGIVTRQIPWPLGLETSSTADRVGALEPRAVVSSRKPVPWAAPAPVVAAAPAAEPEQQALHQQGLPSSRAIASDPNRNDSRSAETESDPARSPNTLFAAANLARRRGDVAKATTLYRLLQARFPGSEEARLSLITRARLELDTGHSTVALALFDQYLRSGRRPLEAEAIVGRAHALRRLDRSTEEAAAWQQVARKYPGSAYAEQAAERLSAPSGP